MPQAKQEGGGYTMLKQSNYCRLENFEELVIAKYNLEKECTKYGLLNLINQGTRKHLSKPTRIHKFVNLIFNLLANPNIEIQNFQVEFSKN